MCAMVEKYTTGLPKLQSSNVNAGAPLSVVLLTGTTGRLGCYLLAQILENPDVQRVYALNRGGVNDKQDLIERQRSAFKAWSLDETLLDGKKIVLLAADLAEETLGLDTDTFNEIAKSVTTIIHNGTSMYSRASYELLKKLL
jgi:thioester reductase-like protein